MPIALGRLQYIIWSSPLPAVARLRRLTRQAVARHKSDPEVSHVFLPDRGILGLREGDTNGAPIRRDAERCLAAGGAFAGPAESSLVRPRFEPDSGEELNPGGRSAVRRVHAHVDGRSPARFSFAIAQFRRGQGKRPSCQLPERIRTAV